MLYAGNGTRMKVCPKSETGQHWWVIDTGSGEVVSGACKYCGAMRSFQNVLGTGDVKGEGRHTIKPVPVEAPRKRGRPPKKPMVLEIPLEVNTSRVILAAPPSVMKAVREGLRDGTVKFSGITSKQVDVTYVIALPGGVTPHP